MLVLSASQSRAADSTRVCKTAGRLKVDRLITLSTSEVAVCCSNASDSSRVRVSSFFSRSRACALSSLPVGRSPRMEAVNPNRTALGTRASSLDHLGGAGEQRRRECESERFCRLEIDQELKLSGLINWDVARFGPFQD